MSAALADVTMGQDQQKSDAQSLWGRTSRKACIHRARTELLTELSTLTDDFTKFKHLQSDHSCEDCIKTKKQSDRVAALMSATAAVGDASNHNSVLETFVPLDVNAQFRMFDLNIYALPDPAHLLQRLKDYYAICKTSPDLVCTTSCFTAWRKAGKTNGSAKLIPGIPADGSENVRVFFFDDNINLHLGGTHDIDGICNLRDITTGEFVDFSVGQNGFQAERAFKHTTIHHSSEYNNVLVQANILDAFGNPDYFSKIISQYSKPGEKLIVFMDVNGTAVFEDTINGKSASDNLLSIMFSQLEVRPDEPFSFAWGSQPPVTIEKPTELRQIVKQISNKDQEFYRNFWSYESCHDLVEQLTKQSNIRWRQSDEHLSLESFFETYEGYLSEEVSRSGEATADGVCKSWITCYQELKAAGHSTVLNSYGVDTRRVIQQCDNEQNVLYININYEMWGKRDVDAWTAQFSLVKPDALGGA